MDILTDDVTYSSLMELLYVDNLVLWGESLNEVMDKYGRWKNAVEGKGWRCFWWNGKVLLFGWGDRVPTGVLHDRVGGYFEDWGYDNSKLSSQIHGSWDEWEKEEGSTKESVGRVYKGVGTIWFEKRGCVQSKQMARANKIKTCKLQPARIMALLLLLF